jgi:serine/threonine-protein kinase
VDIAPPTASEELAVGAQVGEYRIQGTLAVGGMATIYAAVHPVIGKKAAIKVISSELSFSPDAVERFLFEARSVNEIGDPNIVDIFGFGTLPDGRVYLVMEWLVGETLAARCCFEFLTLRETVHIVRTIARTLQTVHECGFATRPASCGPTR